MSSYPSPSSSADPYAPFYYWDGATNTWAFDYEAYYNTYGQPTATPAPETYATQPAYDFDPDTVFTQAAGSAPAKPKKPEVRYGEDGRLLPGKLRKGETRQTVIRKGAGKVWEDQTLLEWDPTHKRLFVGDLGNDVSEATLASAFEKYPSFSRARVIRKKDGKGKGYGFVSFGDPEDFLKAWKEMDGKYIGSRPCRLKKATEEVAPVTIGARKDKQLAMQAKFDQDSYKTKMGGAVGKGARRIGGTPYARK